ncbi:head-tail adaptor protein [Paenibacillus sp. ACRRX]|uniref:head-tail adaptor protein n=1 Tax=Paenibacillus sp. ACRRX TaxID=2918206 RepID=UPI001EF3D849|nr:head-tail adaptor protein [Paenibacillus sp. ACRRX]MCG7410580.1 head-tail adaptor protein [Paenibacillus sp. ACRRX]
MDAGKMRHRMELWGNVDSINELLETSIKPKRMRDVWCEIIPQTGTMQRAQADTIISKCTHKIKMRYGSGKDIKPDMWLQFGVQRFDIKYILNPYFRNESLEIFVEEVVG